jgi:hypothetical protein
VLFFLVCLTQILFAVLKSSLVPSQFVLCSHVCRAWAAELNWAFFRAACYALGCRKRKRFRGSPFLCSWKQTFCLLSKVFEMPKTAYAVGVRTRFQSTRWGLFASSSFLVPLTRRGTSQGVPDDVVVEFEGVFCKERRAKRIAKMLIRKARRAEVFIHVVVLHDDMDCPIVKVGFLLLLLVFFFFFFFFFFSKRCNRGQKARDAAGFSIVSSLMRPHGWSIRTRNIMPTHTANREA